MALKLDMEKAYDMMEWDFTELVMGKFGFAKTSIDLVMGCIRKPSFAVLVNGTPNAWFKSTVGSRQGDPLSPYLLIYSCRSPNEADQKRAGRR